MKTSKLIGLWLFTFIAGGLVGASIVACWPRQANQNKCAAQPTASIAPASLLLTQLEEAGLPEGVSEVAPVQTALESEAQIPSHLVHTTLPQGMRIGGEKLPAAPAEKQSIVLSDGQNTLVLNAQKPAQRASDGSSITMIEAPVQVKRIERLEDYKAFKRQARGSYPAADFAKEEVIVLESASNLPDNVFEIVDIQPENGQLKLYYRVNVFGLDKKTNTHSAQKIKKTTQPLVLEQVL